MSDIEKIIQLLNKQFGCDASNCQSISITWNLYEDLLKPSIHIEFK